MPNQYSVDQIDQLTQCVEQLLQRYEALQRTSATLIEQISTLTQERNSLKLRLDAAHAHTEALIERLPKILPTSTPSFLETPQ